MIIFHSPTRVFTVFGLALLVFGCGQHHAGIVGKWVHPLGISGKAGMAYEFRSDGTYSQYSYVDVSGQAPGHGMMYSPKFGGTYAFTNGFLTYNLTSVKTEEGTASMPALKALSQRYHAVLDGDTLTLSQSQGQHQGPPEEYQRQ